MASKLRNKNQRNTTPADGLDKQDPLDLETLNFEPKGKSKSKKTRLRERQEREKLLQQHRLHQQENLKRQRDRNNVEKPPATAENQQANQHTQREQLAEDSIIVKTLRDVLHESQQPGTEAGLDPVVKSAVLDHESPEHNEEGHGALGDSISPNVKSNLRRCTNCCGRPQVPDRKRRFESTEYISSGNGVDRCAPEDSNEFILTKTSSSHSCVADETTDLEQSASQTSSPQQQSNFKDENETRLRGGCGGGCGGGGGTRNSACCPCGGCGGGACATNTSCDSRPPFGCCGGNQSRGLPCRCKCRSCSNPVPPCGTCGGQNCGKWNSCAGSESGKCCFPRNTRRHNGAGCCGGGSGGGGGCC